MPRARRRTPTCSTSWVRSGRRRHRSPDPAFVAALRERLLAEAQTVLVAAAEEQADADERLRLRPAAPRARRRHRRLAAGISGVILVGASGTMAVAAQNALPGDWLYPLKRSIESAHAQLTFDRAARGRVLLDSASTRLDEAAELSRTGASADPWWQTLDAFTQEAVEGSDLLIADYQATGDQSSITTVRTFTATSMARLRRSRARYRRAPSTSCSRRPGRSTRYSRSRRRPVPAAPGRRSPRCRPCSRRRSRPPPTPGWSPFRQAPGRTTTPGCLPRRRGVPPRRRRPPASSVTDPSQGATRRGASDRAQTSSTPSST